MDVSEFKDVQQKIALFGQLTEDLPIEGFLFEIDRMVTLGPLFNPSQFTGDLFDKADDWAALGLKMKEFQDEWKRIKEAKK